MTTRRQLLKVKVRTFAFLQELLMNYRFLVGHVRGESRKDKGNRIYALRKTCLIVFRLMQEAAQKIAVANVCLNRI